MQPAQPGPDASEPLRARAARRPKTGLQGKN